LSVADDDIADWDAAFVLGALSRQDQSTYEAFLAANPERAAALDELAGLLGRLNLLSRGEALALI
jgi:anti-sigma factor RsiW